MPYNNLKSDENIKTAPNISVLNLEYNELEEITEIYSLKNPARLKLLGNNLKEIKSFKYPGEMLALTLTVSELENYDFLEGMEKLNDLDLSGTDLSNMKICFPDIKKLWEVTADDCQLSDIGIFSSLSRLHRLSVKNNKSHSNRQVP